jgi:hypothetical protein
MPCAPATPTPSPRPAWRRSAGTRGGLVPLGFPPVQAGPGLALREVDGGQGGRRRWRKVTATSMATAHRIRLDIHLRKERVPSFFSGGAGHPAEAGCEHDAPPCAPCLPDPAVRADHGRRGTAARPSSTTTHAHVPHDHHGPPAGRRRRLRGRREGLHRDRPVEHVDPSPRPLEAARSAPNAAERLAVRRRVTLPRGAPRESPLTPAATSVLLPAGRQRSDTRSGDGTGPWSATTSTSSGPGSTRP